MIRSFSIYSLGPRRYRAVLIAVLALASFLRIESQEPLDLNNMGAVVGVTLAFPLDYQVFQRETKLRGHIRVRGTAALPVSVIEVRLGGESLAGSLKKRWRRVSFDRDSGRFDTLIVAAAGGFYPLELRVLRAGRARELLTVPHVGVGEVFIVSGQSNSTNYGETRQLTKTKMVTTFDGTAWRLADDPQPGVQDGSTKGSFVPSFGDALYRKYGVSIGIASVGHGSTSVRQWLPAGEAVEVMPTMTKYVITRPDGALISDGVLFNGMMARIREFGPHGFRALLWHQGESDSHQPPEHDISADTYRRMLVRVIRESRSEAGWDIPWFVAQTSYHNPTDTSCAPIRAAQASLWKSGVALQGPDTDTLTSSFRQNNGQGTHLNGAGLKAHGLLWAAAVEPYIDKQPG